MRCRAAGARGSFPHCKSRWQLRKIASSTTSSLRAIRGNGFAAVGLRDRHEQFGFLLRRDLEAFAGMARENGHDGSLVQRRALHNNLAIDYFACRYSHVQHSRSACLSRLAGRLERGLRRLPLAHDLLALRQHLLAVLFGAASRARFGRIRA